MKKIILTLILLPILGYSQKEMKVMSYNIRLGLVDDGANHWNIRKEKLTDLMQYYEASFIGMQEVQKMQLDYLIDKMKGYDYIGLPRDAGEWAEYSCIFYKKDEFKLLQQNTIWLSQTPDTISKGWDAAFPRIVTYGLFKNRKSGAKFWIANTHFDHVGLTARLESAKMLVNLTDDLKKIKNVPVIITGDFNAKPEENSIQFLKQNLNEASSKSIEKPYGEKDTWNGFDFAKKPENQIDYIFYDKNSNLKVKKYITIDDHYDFKYPSDHLPIMATFLIK